MENTNDPINRILVLRAMSGPSILSIVGPKSMSWAVYLIVISSKY